MPQPWRIGLGVQIALLLSIALLPIGMIAVWQAMRDAREAQILQEQALFADTLFAAGEESAALLEAFGAATGLGLSAIGSGEPASDCSETFARFVANSGSVDFAALLGADGAVLCASAPGQDDLSADPPFLEALRSPRRRVHILEGKITHEQVVVIAQPIVVDGALRGVLTLSIPRADLSARIPAAGSGGGLRLAFVNDRGLVLASDSAGAKTAGWLPRGRDLGTLTAVEPHSFAEMSEGGRAFVYASVPILGGQLAVLSGRRDASGAMAAGRVALNPAVVFPLLMWFVGFLVAYFAVHRLVIRHVRRLGGLMTAFRGGARDIGAASFHDAPPEIAQLGEDFEAMIATIVQDERIKERAIEEKTVLLKEVYHRVKNNLQVMVSIMNTQMRGTPSQAARDALSRLRDIVLGISTIHQRLYTSPDLASVRADQLLAQITEGLAAPQPARSRIETRIAPIALTPDQALPLSLILTELLINALKHSAAAGTEPDISVRFEQADARTVRLTVRNIKADGAKGPADPSDGLSSRLVDAFSRQLNADIDRTETDREYAVSLAFEIDAT